MDAEENSKQQLVLGNDVRAAGRDYFESLSIEKAEEWLALQSDEVRDRYATEGGGAFKLIYRFSVPPEKRAAVIDIKNNAKLTDSRITFLRRTGVLDVQNEVALTPSVKHEVFGWTYTILLAVVALVLLALQPAATPGLGMAMAQLLAGLTYFAIAGLCYYTFVLPNRIGRDALKLLLTQKANC